MVVFLAFVAMIAGACADSPTAPKEQYFVDVDVNNDYPVNLSVGDSTIIGVRSIVIGANTINKADNLIMRVRGDFIESGRIIDEYTYISSMYDNGEVQPRVVHAEFWMIRAGQKNGISWIVFKSMIDPTKKDSIQVVVTTPKG